jgi:Xaa-Pro aminopeptidase
MKSVVSLLCLVTFSVVVLAQDGLPQDYLSPEFHKNRREVLRQQMPVNSVAVFFANPIRNRSNSVDYVYHQDPNFYYLTGYKEPHAVLVIFSDWQTDSKGNRFNEILYVQERNAEREMWTGRRLGAEGVKKQLGFDMAFEGKQFLNSGIDFRSFDQVMFFDFKNDYGDSSRNSADLYDLTESFKQQIGYYLEPTAPKVSGNLRIEINQEAIIPTSKANLETKSLRNYLAKMRQIKTTEELVLLTKAIRISAQGQIESMKAMHPGMSETEIQGIHEFVYKKYGSEYEGYPSIVGAGTNACVLHYIENNKTKVDNDLVLMDVGAEYHGYTADVTRTIPANGKFTKEQKAIYDIVYEAQEAGIAQATVGNGNRSVHEAAEKVINKGLLKLGIITSIDENHSYFPHWTNHHIGLDVHDLNTRGNWEANMVITVEPGIYIPDGSPCDKKWWGIAVRIEDDVLITENGPVLLSFEAPRKSDEIEALMKEPSVLDGFKLPKLD